MGACYNSRMGTFLKCLPVAHRGLHDSEKPENSLAAFEAAMRLGYAIETDLHIVRDGGIAVFHDDTLLRMTGNPRKIEDCTMPELKALSLGNTAEKIPTFEELLALVNGRVPLLIEIKNMERRKTDEIVQTIAKVLDGYRGEYAIQSFNPFYVKAYKKLRPQIMCGVLSSRLTGKDLGGGIKGACKAWMLRDLRLNFTVKPDFVSYSHEGLPCKCVKRFKGYKLAWTVRTKEEAEKALKYVDNIIFEQIRPAIK